ncbi:MAG: thioredoxin domain-containing protein [Bryobacteraceae bacterium]
MRLKVEVSPQDHIQGPETAKVTLVEYGDYECPHCAHAHPVVKRLQQHFGDSLRFVFRNFPLNEMHPLAEPAAEAAEFAGTHGKFWEMHDGIFEHQSRLSVEYLSALAKKNGMDPQALADALSSGAFEERVKQDFMGGVRSGVNGTPTFFINGQRHDAPPEYDILAEAIEASKQG